MTNLIAALPMYDWPESRAEVDDQWAAIRSKLLAAGLDAPERLARRNADMPAVPGGIKDREGRVVAPDPAMLPPDELDLPTLWRHPALLFCQTCWGPMGTTGLAGLVTVVGQPDYSEFEGGEGENYSSAVVMRRADDTVVDRRCSFAPPSVLPDISPTGGEIKRVQGGGKPISPPVGEMSGRTEGGNVEREASRTGSSSLPLPLLRGARLAYNEPYSMSGYLALERDLAAAGENMAIFSDRIETGGHRLSIRAVAETRADVCAIDCRSWALARRFEPAAQRLEVVGWTGPRKGLPYITGRPELAGRIATALA